MKKLLYVLILLFVSVSLLALFINLNDSVEAQENRSDSVVIKATDGYGQQSLLNFLPEQESKIKIGFYNSHEDNDIKTLKIDVYRTSVDKLLEYLVYTTEKNESSSYSYEKITYDNDFNSSGMVYLDTLSFDNYEDDEIILPINDIGVYFVVATVNGSQYNNAMILRTEIASVLNETDDNFLIWNQRVTNGFRLDGGIIEAYNLKDSVKKIAESPIDLNGLGNIRFGEDIDIILVKSNDERVSVLPVHYPEYGYNYSYNIRNLGVDIQQKHYLILDKPIYEPGETMYYKSIIRDDDDANYKIPSGDIRVVVKASGQNDPIYDQIINIKTNGTVDGEIKLPENSPVGYYYLSILDSNSNPDEYYPSLASKYFQVENYRKPEYTLGIDLKDDKLIHGEKISFELDGQYLFGQPLADQKVNVFAKIGWSGDNVLFDEDIKLDDNGKATVEIDTDRIVFDNYYYGNYGSKDVSIEASFNDESGNRVETPTKTVNVYDTYIKTIRDYSESKYSVETNNDAALHINFYEEIDEEDVPIKEDLFVTVDIYREYWEVEENYYDPYTKKTYEKYNVKKTDIISSNLNYNVVAGDKLVVPLNPTSSGSYIFHMNFTDSDNRTVTRKFITYVYDPGKYSYSSETEERPTIALSTDKEEYDLGDDVSLVVDTPYEDRDALLTIERGYTRRYEVVRLRDFNNTITINTQNLDFPNVYTNIKTFSPLDYINKSENIEFNKDVKDIKIELDFGSDSFQPGDDVNLKIRTYNTDGNPVPANVVVWGIDKAIYELSKDQRKPILDYFWSNRHNGTFSTYSLIGIKRSGGAEKGGGGDDSSLRDYFIDTAYWNPSINTDQNGYAEVKFILPDNLTTWAFNSVAATLDTMVGEAEKDIVVFKPLFVRPILPNFLRSGDIFELSTLIYNYTGADQDIYTNCTLDDTDLGEKYYRIENDKQEQTIWSFGEIIKKGEESKINCYAENKNDYSDNIEQSISVYDFGFSEKDVQVAKGQNTFNVSIPDNVEDEKTKASLSLSSSIVGTLPGAMEYLISYPYGCVEQTTSKFVPAVIVRENLDIYSDYIKDKDLDDIINVGIERLEDLSMYNGFRWWNDGYFDAYVTSYATEYLVRAKNLGYEVDQGKLDSIKTNLSNIYNGYYPSHDLGERVAAAYTLGFLNPSGKYPITINDGIDGLTPDILSMAVISNYKAGVTDSNQNGLNALLAMAQEVSGNVWWSEGSGQFFGSKDASTAMVLKALLMVGENDYSEKAIKYLTANRRSQYWSNTFATAQTIDSLTEYMSRNNLSETDVNYIVKINGEEFGRGEIDNSTDYIDIDLTDSNLKDGDKVSVEYSGNNEIYSTLIVDNFVKDREFDGQDNGLKVTREYIGDLIPGETIEVKITVEGVPNESANHLIVQDHLPAGLVPVNMSLKNESDLRNKYSHFSRYEVTDDGVIFAYNRFYYQSDTNVVSTYKARVVSRGEYYAPPAEASLMYLPEINGRSSVDFVKVSDDHSDLGILLDNKIPWWLQLVMIILIIAIILGVRIYNVRIRREEQI